MVESTFQLRLKNEKGYNGAGRWKLGGRDGLTDHLQARWWVPCISRREVFYSSVWLQSVTHEKPVGHLLRGRTRTGEKFKERVHRSRCDSDW